MPKTVETVLQFYIYAGNFAKKCLCGEMLW